MGNLMVTDAVKGHWHVVLDIEGSGVTSVDDDHNHEVVNGVVAAGVDGHVHVIEPMEDPLPAITPAPDVDEDPAPDDPVSFNSPKEAKVLVEAIQIHRELFEREKDSKAEMEEARKFREGEQWTDEQIQTLDADGRAHLVFNYTGAMVDLFSGYSRQNRRDPRALPVEGGDAAICDILNLANKQISHLANCDMHDIDVFEDEVVGGRGVWRVRMDYSKDVQGDVVIERIDDACVRFGPHKKKDASDCEVVEVQEYYTLAVL